MSNTNRTLQRQARALAKEQGIMYTQALTQLQQRASKEQKIFDLILALDGKDFTLTDYDRLEVWNQTEGIIELEKFPSPFKSRQEFTESLQDFLALSGDSLPVFPDRVVAEYCLPYDSARLSIVIPPLSEHISIEFRRNQLINLTDHSTQIPVSVLQHESNILVGGRATSGKTSHVKSLINSSPDKTFVVLTSNSAYNEYDLDNVLAVYKEADLCFSELKALAPDYLVVDEINQFNKHDFASPLLLKTKVIGIIHSDSILTNISFAKMYMPDELVNSFSTLVLANKEIVSVRQRLQPDNRKD